jgi:uncharacterized membrane protein
LITSYDQVAGRSLERIAALSDGMFAGPVHTEQELWAALATLSPRLVTFLLSFLTLGIFWNAQQTQLTHFARADRDLTWLQLAFLAMVALMPFSTSLPAEVISFRIALLAYWANIAFIVLVQLNFAIAPRVPRLSRI